MTWLHWVFWVLVLVALVAMARWVRSDSRAHDVGRERDEEMGR